MIWTIVLGIVTLVLTLIALWFAFEIKLRSIGRLAASWDFFIFSMVIFGIAKIIGILNDSKIISTRPLESVLYTLFILLLVIGFWYMLKCVKEVDGELKSDHKIKVIKH